MAEYARIAYTTGRVVARGTIGPRGHGVPAGGTTGQVPVKLSDDDYDIGWDDQSGGVGVTDGDKGDITVSGSGATWTVDASVLAAAGATHIADGTAAHAASAISIADAGNDFAATDVEGALAELQADHEADATALTDHVNDSSAAHAASAISASSATLVGTGTDVQAVLEELDNGIADHLADTSAAHAASAISASSTTLVGVATDVQGVLEELDNAIVAAETSITALDDLTDGTEITWDNTTTPGNVVPILGETVPRVILNATPAATVTSTSSATSLLSATFTPAANQLAVGDVLIFDLTFGTIQNVGSDQTVTLRLRYNSANLWTSLAMTLPTSASQRYGLVRIITRIISTSGGTLGGAIGKINMSDPAAGAGVTADPLSRTVLGTAQTIDLASPAAFDLTVQHQSAGSTQASVLYSLICTHYRTP